MVLILDGLGLRVLGTQSAYQFHNGEAIELDLYLQKSLFSEGAEGLLGPLLMIVLI